ncbi:MAG: preprotein translocase subunit YajC [Gammaproteobacteria bacterium]|nr:preprotein translocase subunit YajC [Gammaproteobacteria bacterium]
MDFFISNAMAEGAQVAGNDFAGLLMPMAILVFFYFLFIRPGQKRAKEHKKMVDSLSKGTELVTTGGLLGKVAHVDDNFIGLEVSPEKVVWIQRSAISSLMPKGTYKALVRNQ